MCDAASQSENLMPYYLFQWKYKDPSIPAMIEAPQDRSAELRKAVEAFHGRMHQFFFAFGEHVISGSLAFVSLRLT